MPFDGTGYDPPGSGRGQPPVSDTLITWLIVGIAALLLLTPISLAALADIVHALLGT